MNYRDEKASDRTQWAEDRTIMANERRYNSFVALGLGMVGVAIALRAVFGEIDPKWAAKLVASLFLGVAVLTFWLAQRQAIDTLDQMETNDAARISTRNFRLLTWLTSLAAVATGGLLWAL